MNQFDQLQKDEGTIKVSLYMASNSPHIFQAVTGFLLLQDSNLIQVSFLRHQMKNKEINIPNEHCLVAYIADNILVYDMADGYNFKKGFNFESTLKNVDYYFKRSFSEDKNKTLVVNSVQRKKIFPYGFNYYVYHPKIPIPNTDKIRTVTKHLYCKLKRDKFYNYTVDNFTKEPNKGSTPPRIIFCTRLWNEDCYTKNELEHINGMRITLIRNLKRLYGENFVGGVSKCDLAEQICPDIVLPDNISRKSKYLQLMHDSDICIGSIGLYQSIGWKTGEYVAASKAIVNEKFSYEVTGPFIDGENYLSFTTVKECMQAVDFLFNNHDEIRNMKLKNYEYYNRYGSPTKLIENSLNTAGIFLE